jgi:phospholipid:diacylglycerol acyltransferase
MSALRRRIGDAFRQKPSPSPSPDAQQRIPVNGEEVQLIPVSKLKRLTTSKRSKRGSGLIFGLGGLVGILVAVFFANKQEVLNLESLIDFNLDSILDVIPAGIVKDARDITVRSFSA